jgi:hypothetical protein
MTRYPTPTQLLAKQQRDRRMAQRIVGMMACAWLLLTATMIAGWILTW